MLKGPQYEMKTKLPFLLQCVQVTLRNGHDDVCTSQFLPSNPNSPNHLQPISEFSHRHCNRLYTIRPIKDVLGRGMISKEKGQLYPIRTRSRIAGFIRPPGTIRRHTGHDCLPVDNHGPKHVAQNKSIH
jgi:hypothetical protein